MKSLISFINEGKNKESGITCSIPGGKNIPLKGYADEPEKIKDLFDKWEEGDIICVGQACKVNGQTGFILHCDMPYQTLDVNCRSYIPNSNKDGLLAAPTKKEVNKKVTELFDFDLYYYPILISSDYVNDIKKVITKFT